MSKQSYGPVTPMSDAFGSFLEGAARLVLWAGIAATVLSVGFLLYTYHFFSGGGIGANVEQAISNVELFQKLLVAGVIAAGVGATYLFWGEETLGAFLLVGAAALFFAPLYVPLAFGSQNAPNDVGQKVLGAFQLSGIVFGVLAIAVTVTDVLQRVQLRAKQGSKADQLKYGKGIKEERDIQNVFMGKCWQLPFCRKFVRERCPIYHSRRTCWKERVGCMCEEQVIRDAMSGKTIPKDAVAAAKYIPYNTTLTMAQKEERCRQCVIYNEHQKHKYKLVLPATLVFFVGMYVLLRVPLLGAMDALLESLDRMIGRATFQPADVSGRVSQSGLPFQEILLVCLMVVAFTYALKLIEFLIFKLKV